MKSRLLWLSSLILWGLSAQLLAWDVVPVALKQFPKSYQFDARIEAVNEATVASRISAQVIAINYDVNDFVPQNAVLIRFKDTEFKAKLAQAKSSLMATQAQYEEALARQKEAAAEAKRMTDLFERKQVTRSALDKAQADTKAADARVSTLYAQIKQAQAKVDEAEEALSYTVIRAPYSGTVTQRHIEVGETASPGQLLMSGVSLTTMRAVVKVPQRLIHEVASATDIDIMSDQQWFPAGQITVLPEADALSHSFTVRVALDEKLKFYQGSMSKIRFINGTESRLVMPKSALIQRGDVSAVYVETEQGVLLRQIRLGESLNEWQEVLAGLSVGEQVLINPQQYLQAN